MCIHTIQYDCIKCQKINIIYLQCALERAQNKIDELNNKISLNEKNTKTIGEIKGNKQKAEKYQLINTIE